MSCEPTIAWVPSSWDASIASMRLRALLPCKYLRKAGWRCELVDPKRAGSYDLLVFQKAYDEAAIELARRARRRGTVTVLDLCDNHFYNPDRLPELAARAERLERMLDTVQAVSVSTETLARLVPGRGAAVIADALDEISPPRFRSAVPGLPGRRDSPLRLVWYGNAGLESPSFGLVHLPRVLPVLAEVSRTRPLELTVISNSRQAFKRAVADTSIRTSYCDWRGASFARMLCRHDVCIIPIERNPFTVCKTGNRVALALRLRIPVVADRIPSFDEFAEFVVLDNWIGGLERYATDPGRRAADARRGQRYVEATYTSARVVSEWSDLFARLLEHRPEGLTAAAGNPAGR